MQENGKEKEAASAASSQEKKPEANGKKIQLIIFKLGTEEYGLSIDQIKEVVITPGIAHVPHMPSYIKGVANIRGSIISIMDLEEKFGLKSDAFATGESAGNYTLVIESSAFKVGILVKEVPNTLSVYTGEIEDASAFIKFSSIDENCITGIVKSGGRLIILIDVFKLIDIENITNTAINKAIS